MHPDSDQPLTLAQMAGPRPRRTALVIGVAVGIVVLVAAAVVAMTRRPAAAPAPQQQPQAAGTTAAAAPPAATSSAASAAPVVLKLGVKADGVRATSVAYSYKQPVATNATRPDQEGFEWGAADVEICVKVGGVMSRYSWRLTYADHTTIEPSGTGYRQFPQPEYPWGERELSDGQCIRGWITFAVPAGKRPATIQYQPSNFKADWAVA